MERQLTHGPALASAMFAESLWPPETAFPA
jgi:hypothetical protein